MPKAGSRVFVPSCVSNARSSTVPGAKNAWTCAPSGDSELAVNASPGSRPLLLADIGGTHARFLLTHETVVPTTPLQPENRLDLRATNFETFEDLIATVLEDIGIPSNASPDAVFALAGPVEDTCSKFTNRPWLIDANALRERFGFHRIALINDLAAAARVLSGGALPEHEVLQDAPGSQLGRRRVLVSVGTGLGCAYWSGGARKETDAAEAGHAGMSAHPGWQMEWLETLQAVHGRVSWERALSGDGLAGLDAWLRNGALDEARNVVERAHSGSVTARRAIRLFAEMLGGFTGDLVLSAPASGGVWLAGGVLRGMDRLFDAAAFFEGFCAKGRMSERMTRVPVRWTRDGDLGLRGAWLLAADLRRGLMQDEPS